MVDPDLVTLRSTQSEGTRTRLTSSSSWLASGAISDELRKLADRGSSDAVDILVELAGERGDRGELQRLAANRTPG